MSTYLVSDIHGDLANFKKILKLIEFNPHEDFMYVIGDVLDRGKDGIALLNFIRRFIAADRMLLIKGNHEYFAQLFLEGKLSEGQWSRWGGGDTIEDIRKLSEEEKVSLHDFIEGLPFYELVDTYKWGEVLLTHTGILESAIVERSKLISTVDSIDKACTEKELEYLLSNDIHSLSKKQLKQLDRYLIVGHVPTMQLNKKGKPDIFEGKYYMCIDCGAGYRADGGRLGVLRLEDSKQFYV